MLCALWTHYIWPNVMSLNLQTFLTCSFSPAVVDILSLSPWWLPIPSALAVTPLLLSDGLFCCLKHLIGGQVYIIRGEFSVATASDAVHPSFCFHASSFHRRSLVLDWRTLLHGCWRFDLWKIWAQMNINSIHKEDLENMWSMLSI